MKGFVGDIEKSTLKGSDFRHVLYTGKNMQLVLMSLKPGEEIGEEVHLDRDQFFRIEKGEGEVWIDGRETKIASDVAIIVPAGARHNVRNTGVEPMKLYTLYAPPEHADGTVHVTKADAQAAEEPTDTPPSRASNQDVMLWTIVAVLLVLWLLGMFGVAGLGRGIPTRIP